MAGFSSDSDGAVDAFDENLIKDAQDEQWLFSLPEVEREEIIASRYEERRRLEEERKVRRQLRRKQKSAAASSAGAGSSSQKAAAKAASAKKKRVSSAVVYRDDEEELDFGVADEDEDDEDFGEVKRPAKRARTAAKSSRDSALASLAKRRRAKGLSTKSVRQLSSEESVGEESSEEYFSEADELDERFDEYAGARGMGRQAQRDAASRQRRMVEITAEQAASGTEEPAHGWKQMKSVVLTRTWLEDHCDEPWFERTVPGFFVRLAIGSGQYRLARIDGVVRNPKKEYSLSRVRAGAVQSTDKYLRLRVGDNVHEWEIRPVSNNLDAIAVQEFNFLRHEAIRKLDSWHQPVEHAFENQPGPADHKPPVMRGGTPVAILENKPWLTVGDIEDLRDRKKASESYVWREEDIQENIARQQQLVMKKDIGIARQLVNLRNLIQSARDEGDEQKALELEAEVERLQAIQEEKVHRRRGHAISSSGTGRADSDDDGDEGNGGVSSASLVKDINRRATQADEERRLMIARGLVKVASKTEDAEQKSDPFSRRRNRPRSLFASLGRVKARDEKAALKEAAAAAANEATSSQSQTDVAAVSEEAAGLQLTGSGLGVDPAYLKKLKQQRAMQQVGWVAAQAKVRDLDLDLDVDMSKSNGGNKPSTFTRPLPSTLASDGKKKLTLADYMSRKKD